MTEEEYRELFNSVTPEEAEKTKKIIDNFKENAIYVKRPGKDIIMRAFVQGAIDFSNDFSVDVEIVKREDRITVCFSFEDTTVFTELKDVMALSDEIVIDKNPSNNKTELMLDFITHITITENYG